MKYCLGISNFLEEISSLSNSSVFFCFFEFITEEGFLISPSYSLELCIQSWYLSFFPLPFASLSSQLFVRPPQTSILPFCISFSWDGIDHCLLYNVTNLCPVFLPGESQGQGAWWAAVCGVAQSWTRLKPLSSSSSSSRGSLKQLRKEEKWKAKKKGKDRPNWMQSSKE